MQDLFSRKINYLRLSVTGRCNFGCAYCSGGRGDCPRSDELSVDEIRGIVRAAASLGCTKVRLTGGEPLIRHDIAEICRTVMNVPGVKKLCLTTNGYYLSRHAGILMDAGVSCVNISLDTADDERFYKITGRRALGDVLSGIDAALASGFDRGKINAVLLHGVNDDVKSVRDLASLTERYPVDLRFIELMPSRLIGESYGRSFVSADLVFESLPGLERSETPEDAEGVAEMYRIPGAPGRVGIISPMSACFCHRCSRIRVLSDGRVRPCLLRNTEYDLRGLSYEDTVAVLRKAVLMKPLNYGEEIGTGAAQCEMKRIGG